MTLAVPDDLYKEIRSHNLKWADIARQALAREVDRLHVLDRLLAGSRLTEEDAVELGRSIRRSASRR